MKSLTCKMLNDMSDGRILSNIEMSQLYGWRFGARIFQLKEYGVEFEKEQGKGYIEYWKITHIPENIIYKDRNCLKVIKTIKPTLLEKMYNLIFE